MATKTAKTEEALVHCFHCRKKRTCTVQYRVTENGRGMLQGTCNKCDTKVSVMTKLR
jgi:Domain of unknown function (DUF5679)